MGGKSIQWPVANPMMVAPVNLTFSYEAYHHPINSEYRPEGISITIPPDYTAGFNFTNPANGTSEIYALRSMLIRKPGHIPEGASQVLSHILEVSLVHQEMTGTGYWATVVAPFEVGNDVSADILTHLTDEAELPSQPGDISPLLVSDAKPLELNQIWDGATFFHSWATLPTNCGGITANTRQFHRNTTLMVGQYTFHRLLDALRKVAEVPPMPAPTTVWALLACQDGAPEGDCVPLTPTNLKPDLDKALKLQSEKLVTLRDRKAIMDKVLVQIQNNSLPSLMSAIAARDNLRNAQTEFESAAAYVNQLQNFVWQAGNATWDSDKPKATGPASTGLVWLNSEEASLSLLSPAAATVRSASASAASGASAGAASAGAAEPGVAVNYLFGAGRPLNLLRRQARQQQLTVNA